MILDIITFVSLYILIALACHTVFTVFLMSQIETVELKGMHQQWITCWNGRKAACTIWFISVPILLYFIADAKIRSLFNSKG